jgi:hypothetical protein
VCYNLLIWASQNGAGNCTGNQCSHTDTFHSRSLTAHHELRISFVNVAIGINLTQQPTHDTSSKNDDAFHEDRIGLQAEDRSVQFLHICTQTAYGYLSILLLVY